MRARAPAGEAEGSQANGRREPVEIVPDKLYVVGGNVPLLGQASWAPADATGYQPANAYLLLGDDEVDETLVVDPGLPYVEEGVVLGLRALLPTDAKLRVFLTRAQFDCLGNLGAVAELAPIEDIFTGGFLNPFDSFDSATSVDAKQRARHVALLRSPGASRLEVINTALRMLATFWAYDAQTRTLFTSDSFTHAVLENREDPPVVDSLDADRTTIDDVRSHLLATFWWLQYADKRAIAEDVVGVFDRYDVEVVAPDRGCVLKGKDVVERHAEMVINVLQEAGEDSIWL